MTPVLVTGSTDGIGRAAAGLLAAAGVAVVVHGKDPAKGAAALAELRARHPDVAVDLVRPTFGIPRQSPGSLPRAATVRASSTHSSTTRGSSCRPGC
jgi:NAD(P)-dependent dehydrogenase (short-subunit alcohol dehydrogenase family)